MINVEVISIECDLLFGVYFVLMLCGLVNELFMLL